MITLNTTTFEQALTGNALVFFHRLKGCPNCDKMLPIVESYAKEGLNVFGVDCDTEKDLVSKYAPKGNWNLPLFVYFENGVPVVTRTGMIDIEEATKTLQNISDFELQKIQIDLELKRATQRKEMFETETSLNKVNQEIQTRVLISQQVTEQSTKVVPKPFIPEIVDPSDDTGCDGCQ